MGLSIEPVQLVPVQIAPSVEAIDPADTSALPLVIPYVAGNDASREAAKAQASDVKAPSDPEGSQPEGEKSEPKPEAPEGSKDTAKTEEPSAEAGKSEPDAPKPMTEADAIRAYVAEHPTATNKHVIEGLAAKGVQVNSTQVSRYRK